jgi:acetyltransferase-like isoleucine patch superfamily enzyme
MSKQNYYRHPQALVESSSVGDGTRIWAFAHVMEGAVVGQGCNLGDHAFVEAHAQIGNHVTIKNGVSIWDGVVLEDNVFVGPNAAFTNDMNPRATVRKSRNEFLPTLVREGASIGANATIVCGNTIGRYAFIGAGAVVTRDVEDYAIVVGSPARKIGYMCACGQKIKQGTDCSCGHKMQTVAAREASSKSKGNKQAKSSSAGKR